MSTLVSTGQLTIVDNNDARPISGYLTITPGPQQIYSKDNDTVTYNPSWMTANTNTGALITAKVFLGGVGSSTEITPNLTARKFTLTPGGTDILTATTSTSFVNDSDVVVNTPFTVVHDATGSTLKIKGNLLQSIGMMTIFFEGKYADPTTGLESVVLLQITLSVLKTGSNAVYILTRGNTLIEEANGTTKNVTAIAADVIRTSGTDTSNILYKWFEAGGATQISTSLSGYATKYGMKTTTSGASPSAAVNELNQNIPVLGSSNSHNTLVISESAIVDLGIFKVEATDTVEGKTYSAYFTVYDVSDPYDLVVVSSSGDKLQNGQGSTNVNPIVYQGTTLVSLTDWTFTWTFYNRNGKRAAFIDTTRTAVAGGRNITAHTSGVSGAFTYSGAAITFAAGDIVKVVSPLGVDKFYEVASGAGGTVTIRTPVLVTWLNFTDYPAPTANEFLNGKLYVCTANGTRSTTAGAAITVTGDEIDSKGTITCEAYRP